MIDHGTKQIKLLGRSQVNNTMQSAYRNSLAGTKKRHITARQRTRARGAIPSWVQGRPYRLSGPGGGRRRQRRPAAPPPGHGGPSPRLPTSPLPALAAPRRRRGARAAGLALGALTLSAAAGAMAALSAARPKFVLFGDSLTQRSFDYGGWGAALASQYARKARARSPSLARQTQLVAVVRGGDDDQKRCSWHLMLQRGVAWPLRKETSRA